MLPPSHSCLRARLAAQSAVDVFADKHQPVRPDIDHLAHAELAFLAVGVSLVGGEAVVARRLGEVLRDAFPIFVANEKLVRRAVAYLPLPKLRPSLAGSAFAMLAMAHVAANGR